MIEKKFKQSFIFTVSALLLFSSATVFASQNTPDTKRLSGADGYATSAAVALSGWTQSNYAILTSGENFPDAISAVDKIEFISTDLTKTGPNTATFQYKVLDKNGADITRTVPVSEIGAVASVSSSIILDSLTGTGTITFKSSSDADKQVIVTLVVAGKSATLNAQYSESQPIDIFGLLPVAKIDFPSTNVTKIGTSKATFSYKILDKNGTDITKIVPASDLYAFSWVGSSSSPVSLNPQTGTGTITYNFSDTDKNIRVQIVYNNGIVGTSTLSFGDSKTVN